MQPAVQFPAAIAQDDANRLLKAEIERLKNTRTKACAAIDRLTRENLALSAQIRALRSPATAATPATETLRKPSR